MMRKTSNLTVAVRPLTIAALLICGCQAGGNDFAKQDITRSPECNESVIEVLKTRGVSIDTNKFIKTRQKLLKKSTGQTFRLENEAHDCQRLIVSNAYGPLVTLLINKKLDPDTDFSFRPVLIGLITASDDYGDLSSSGKNTLRFKKGENCLYLKKTGKVWKSWVVPNSTSKCPTTADETANADWELFVYSQANQDDMPPDNSDPHHPKKYPPPIGGRIIESTDHYYYYLGLQCELGTWCVLGVKKSGEKPGSLPKHNDARGDYQRLAAPNGTGGVQPLKLAAYIELMDDAWGKPDPENYSNKVDVARIIFEGTDVEERKVYGKKFGTAGPDYLLPDTVILSLQYDTRTKKWTVYLSTGWSKEITKYKHMDAQNMVRWAWSGQDEKTWVQCATGCCGVEY